MSDLVKLYNPASAGSLTPDQIEGLQKLTSAEIKELATAYPNTTMQRAYLLIIDNSKPVDKQLPMLSSFENLWNLREKNGLKKYVAFNFKGGYKVNAVASRRKSEVVDLSETELLSLPGFNKPLLKPGEGGIKSVQEIKTEDLSVPVTKIKKVSKTSENKKQK